MRLKTVVFPAPLGADQPDDLALLDGEAQPIEGLHPAEPHRQLLDL
jgi:hypothetical protein